MGAQLRFRYLGGRKMAIMQTFIRGILGIVLILVGIIMAIIQMQILFLVIFGLIGIIVLLNSWWWWRRAKQF